MINCERHVSSAPRPGRIRGGFGCASLGYPSTQHRASSVGPRLDAGITWLDVAPSYWAMAKPRSC